MVFFLLLRRRPASSLFPYTTLFRSEFGGQLRAHFLDVPLVEARIAGGGFRLGDARSEEHTSELQSPVHLVCRLLLVKTNQPRGAEVGRLRGQRPRRVARELARDHVV